MTDDHINPDHYKGTGYECIETTEGLPFNLGNAFKYQFRAGSKLHPGCTAGESAVIDLEKCIWYLEREVSRVKRRIERVKLLSETMDDTEETIAKIEDEAEAPIDLDWLKPGEHPWVGHGIWVHRLPDEDCIQNTPTLAAWRNQREYELRGGWFRHKEVERGDIVDVLERTVLFIAGGCCLSLQPGVWCIEVRP